MRLLKLMVAVLVLGLFALAWAQGDTKQVTYMTTAPTSGSAVVAYHWEMSVSGGPYSEVATSTGLSATLSVPWNAAITVRVRGRDADGDFGPYSVASDPFTADRPGACGKPVRQ